MLEATEPVTDQLYENPLVLILDQDNRTDRGRHFWCCQELGRKGSLSLN